MTTKLVQKHLLINTRAFEIAEDLVHVRIQSPFSVEKLTVALSMLDPEPVVNGRYLEFHGRVKREPMLSLYRDKPDAEAFGRFVDALKQRAREEYSAFTGIRAGHRPADPAANRHDEPPEFDAPERPRMDKAKKPIRVESLDSSISMLRQHLDIEEIKPLLAALEALKAEPENESCFDRMVNAFEDLGSHQGAVLTYAPYVGILLSDDPFGY